MPSATILDSAENIVLSPLRDHGASACSLHWPATTGPCARQAAEGGGPAQHQHRGREDRTWSGSTGECCSRVRSCERVWGQVKEADGTEGRWTGQQPCKVGAWALRAPKHGGGPAEWLHTGKMDAKLFGKQWESYFSLLKKSGSKMEKRKARMNPPVSY